MTTSAENATLLDTSTAVALVLSDHEQHETVADELAGLPLGLAGHAAWETFSVLTRLPPPLRLSPAAASRVLAADFPHTVFLDSPASTDLLQRLPGLRLAGGAVYDALVGAAAASAGRPLVSLDRRAAATYAAVGAQVRLL